MTRKNDLMHQYFNNFRFKYFYDGLRVQPVKSWNGKISLYVLVKQILILKLFYKPTVVKYVCQIFALNNYFFHKENTFTHGNEIISYYSIGGHRISYTVYIIYVVSFLAFSICK